MKDPDLLDHLDTSLQAKQSSLLFPIEESAKEQIKPGRRQEDKFVTEPELGALLSITEINLLKRGIKLLAAKFNLIPLIKARNGLLVAIVRFEVSVILM